MMNDDEKHDREEVTFLIILPLPALPFLILFLQGRYRYIRDFFDFPFIGAPWAVLSFLLFLS